MKKKKNVELGERELDIMQVLWRLGEATVTEVHAELIAQGGSVAYNTVQTMLNRLEGKRLVARDNSERAHKYYPLIKEPAVVGSAIRRLTNRFFKGSPEALTTHLIEENLSAEQLERIQSLIDAHRRGKSRK
ncbi:MAG TPA: BlaI/MecI/CopY family transcriptional regulator [Pyrinomonadaceae bacterium]|nr:BlaI/MecI/CopY family transcriptional regulator [Pyrinomonadaceae bacterium]